MGLIQRSFFFRVGALSKGESKRIVKKVDLLQEVDGKHVRNIYGKYSGLFSIPCVAVLIEFLPSLRHLVPGKLKLRYSGTGRETLSEEEQFVLLFINNIFRSHDSRAVVGK